jgi:hypothetical protein
VYSEPCLYLLRLILLILDFQYGIDNEAKKFKAFPMFRIITENGITDYTDKREVSSIQEAINNAI